ncbi:uncharacterized [Tachysurus ichikawai]
MKEERRFWHFIIINDKDTRESPGGRAVAAWRRGEKWGGGRQPYGSGKADGAVRQAVRIPWLLSITHVTIEPARRKTTGVHESPCANIRNRKRKRMAAATPSFTGCRNNEFSSSSFRTSTSPASATLEAKEGYAAAIRPEATAEGVQLKTFPWQKGEEACALISTVSGLHEKDSWPFGLGSPHPPKQQGASSTGQNRAIEELGVGWRCLQITSPCLGPVSLLSHSDMPALQARGRVTQQQHNTDI